MAYADQAALLARAGRLQDAWSATSSPTLSDLDVFLTDAAAEIDAAIAARGFAVPVSDETALPALRGVNADKALLLALRATWPGGSAPAAASDLIADVEKRVDQYDALLSSGDLPALLYLASTSAASEEAGASDFWTKDGIDYDYWVTITAMWPRYWLDDPWGIPASMQPQFRRTERF